MYQYQPSPRIERLREVALEGSQATRYAGFRGLCFAEAFAAGEGHALVQRRGRGLAAVISRMPVEIAADEVLAGHHYLGREDLDFPDLGGWPPEQELRLRETLLTPEERGRYHRLATQVAATRAAIPPSVEPLPAALDDEQQRQVTAIWGTIFNHSVRGYEKVLRCGFEGLLGEIEARLAGLPLTDPAAARKRAFWSAAGDIARAAAGLGPAYARAAGEELAGCTDTQRRADLLALADACEQVPARPARTFREAVQALWFSHMITCWEDGVNANSIGRIDQILYPYYKADRAAGRITEDEAMELLAALWIKLYRSYDVQQVMVGGLGPDGADATNDVSLMVLAVTRGLRFVRCLSVRLHRDSPRPLVEMAADLVADGGGIPFFFNDDTLIPALVANGIAVEDARDYAAIGCVEITIPGKACPHAVSNWVNLAKCLELTLNDGRDPCDGAQVGPATGCLADMRSMDDVWEAYTRQVRYFVEHCVYGSNRAELADEATCALPYLSLLTDDCVQRGADITWGGAHYNYHSSAAVGIPNVADSLAALEQLVFTERLVSPRELAGALAANYAGQERLRQALLHRAPKYGNDRPAVDAWAGRVTRHYCELLGGYRTARGGPFLVHLFSFTLMLPMGKRTGALPDGRRGGEPLAYSVSPGQGRDERGLTAVLASLSRLPHHLAAASSSAIIEVDPALLAGGGRAKFADLLQTAIGLGVGQMQFNVVSADTLRQAQQEPERYRSLCVRVSGFSQQFVLLGREMQDHIIARTKHQQA
jgi:pyruvate formate-lyase/glycerol dehydratase family glycyl radical enzyme